MDALPVFLRLSGRAVVLVGDGEAADAKRRLIEAAGGTVVADHRPGVTLAFVALDEPEATAARLRAAGCLVNVVDRPGLCDFTVPAIVDRSPVIVAIGTGGASASLATALRQRLERLLPARLGGLAAALKGQRGALAARWPDVADRRRVLAAALAEGGRLDPLADPDPADVAMLDAPAADRTVTILLRSDDPDDLTLREARWLAQADRLAAAGDVPEAVLGRARRDAVRDGASGGGLTVVVRRA